MVDARTVWSSFDDHGGDVGCECGDGTVEIAGAGDAADLGFAGQEDVHVREKIVERRTPVVVGVVVGVERDGEASLFEACEELGQTVVESTLEVERGEVQVAGLCEVIEVEGADRELGDGAGIGEDVAFGAVREEQRDAGGGGAGEGARCVDAGCGETLERDATEVIGADHGSEGDS